MDSKGGLKERRFACDFETEVDSKKTRVWASIIVDIESLTLEALDTSIYGFMNYAKRNNGIYYFHNLKYDGAFILDHLLKEGYKFDEDLSKAKTFRTLITSDGAFYSLEIKFNYNKKTRKWQRVKIYDSLKIIPLSIEAIAKAFKTPMLKGEIDYKKHHREGYRPDFNETSYILNDAMILAHALHEFIIDEGNTKMTIASNALSYYKGLQGSYFRKNFPIIDEADDALIRKAYRGGWCYVNPLYANKKIGEGITLDVNSLYPAVMYQDLLPYGVPLYFKGEGKEISETEYPLRVYHVVIDLKLKGEHLPTLQDKAGFRFLSTEYITNTEDEPIDTWLTSVDLELIKEQYDINYIDIVEGYAVAGSHGLFKDYIDHFGGIKATSVGGRRTIAKLFLNSLYGKFATNPVGDLKIPYLKEDRVFYKRVPGNDIELVYTIMGVFITAYARARTIRTAQAVYKRFTYADTDSVHLIGKERPLDVDIHESRIGAWKIEESFTKAYYIRPKTYYELLDNGNLNITCAGLPKSIRSKLNKDGTPYVNMDNFKKGSIFEGKLMPIIIPGGIYLKEVNFTIKA